MNGAGTRSILRNSLYLIGGQTAEVLIRAAYAVVLGRLLGETAYGLYGYAVGLSLTFLPLAGLGLDLVISRAIGQRQPGHESVLRVAFALRFASSLLAAGVLLALAWCAETDGAASRLLSIFAAGLFARSMAEWGRGVLIAYERAGAGAVIGAALRLAEVIVGAVVLWRGGGLQAVAWLYAAQWWAQAVFVCGLVQRRYQGLTPRFDRTIAKTILTGGLWITGAGLASAWIRQGPVVLYRWLGAGAELGDLALAMQLAQIALIPFVAIASAATPVLSRAVDRGQNEDIVFLDSLFRLALLVFGAAWLFTEAFGPSTLPLVFGKGFAQSSALLGFAFAAMVPLAWNTLLVRHAIARSAERGVFAIAVGSAMLFAALALLLIPAHGAAGSLWACAAALCTCALVNVICVGGDAGARLLRTCLVSLVCLAAMFACLRLLPYGLPAAAVVLLVRALTARRPRPQSPR